jgi:hypothetical protein
MLQILLAYQMVLTRCAGRSQSIADFTRFDPLAVQPHTTTLKKIAATINTFHLTIQFNVEVDGGQPQGSNEITTV